MTRLAHILVCHSADPTKAIETIPHQIDALWYVFLHSSNAAIETTVYRLMAEREGNVFPYCENRGLSRSWNEGLHLATEAGCDASILLNDDLFFYEDGYTSFAAQIDAILDPSKNIALSTPLGRETGPHGQVEASKEAIVRAQGFACCAITVECINRIGYFDENFAPAYFEDWDYIRRIQRAGMDFHYIQEVLCEHERSSTRQAMTAAEAEGLEKDHEANRLYYFAKWGDSHEYATPFNIREYSIKIPFSQRSDPYPLQEQSLVAGRKTNKETALEVDP